MNQFVEFMALGKVSLVLGEKDTRNRILINPSDVSYVKETEEESNGDPLTEIIMKAQNQRPKVIGAFDVVKERLIKGLGP